MEKDTVRFITINYVLEIFEDLYLRDINEDLELDKYPDSERLKIKIVIDVLDMLNISNEINKGGIKQCKTLGDILETLYTITQAK